MTHATPTTVACPSCKHPVVWDSSSPFKPFCSERCRLIDLGDWATEAFRIPVEPVVGEGDEAVFDPHE
jgi:endogenous inhibitor of DNA gyrase (YacG/DUF329 family)